jgi:hypothetical protein
VSANSKKLWHACFAQLVEDEFISGNLKEFIAMQDVSIQDITDSIMDTYDARNNIQ